eukprot:UN04316
MKYGIADSGFTITDFLPLFTESNKKKKNRKLYKSITKHKSSVFYSLKPNDGLIVHSHCYHSDDANDVSHYFEFYQVIQKTDYYLTLLKMNGNNPSSPMHPSEYYLYSHKTKCVFPDPVFGHVAYQDFIKIPISFNLSTLIKHYQTKHQNNKICVNPSQYPGWKNGIIQNVSNDGQIMINYWSNYNLYTHVAFLHVLTSKNQIRPIHTHNVDHKVSLLIYGFINKHVFHYNQPNHYNLLSND